MAKQCNLCQSSYDETLDCCPACSAAEEAATLAQQSHDSPLSASLVVERPSRIAIEESEVAAATAAGGPTATMAGAAESQTAADVSSQSEFDLSLLRLEALEAERAAVSSGELQPLLAHDPPGNFGVHLLEDHGLVETNLEINLDGLLDSPSDAEPSSPLENEPVCRTHAHLQGNGQTVPPACENGRGQGGEAGTGMPQHAEQDPVVALTPWAAPGASVQLMNRPADPARSDFSWLKGTIFGLVVGIGLCLALAAAGVRLPAGLGTARNPNPAPEPSLNNQAGAGDPLPGAEELTVAPSPLPDRQGQYRRLQASSAAAAERSQQAPDLSGNVEGLRTENQQLHRALEQIRVLLKAGPIQGKSPSLEKDLKKLVEAKEAAVNRAGDLEKTLTRAQSAITSTERQVSTLKEQLKHSEKRLADAEKQLKQNQAARGPATQEHTSLKVSEAQPAPDPVAAYAAYSRALAFYHQGNYAEAQKGFASAARLDDQDARYYYLLGLCRWQLGHRDQATADFRQAVVLEQANKPSGAFVRPVLEEMPAAALDQIEHLRRR